MRSGAVDAQHREIGMRIVADDIRTQVPAIR